MTQWPKQLYNTNGPFCAFKIRALLTNKGQYLPLSAPRPLGGGQIGVADQIMNSWPDVGVKWTRRCHRNGNLCFACSSRWITRGYKLLIITWQLWRANEDPRRCGSPMECFSFCFSGIFFIIIMHASSSFCTRREHKSHQFLDARQLKGGNSHT